MPRKAREKDSSAIYHVICRSISETLRFKDDEDKDKYLMLLKTYSSKFKCSVYAYCLMDNHLHIQIDPKGYDISSFMHGLNTSYVIYFNKKHERHGHLFQDRFHSEIVDSDRYSLVLSAYIHNNPKDVPCYKGREEEYKYSSYGIYLGIMKDRYGLIDTSFIQNIFGIKNKRSFIRRYKEFVSRTSGEYSIEQHDESGVCNMAKDESASSRIIIKRERVPAKVIDYIVSRLDAAKQSNSLPEKGQNTERSNFKAFTAYILQAVCGMRYKQICEHLLDISLSSCSKLCNKGFELLERGEAIYSDIFKSIVLSDL